MFFKRIHKIAFDEGSFVFLFPKSNLFVKCLTGAFQQA